MIKSYVIAGITSLTVPYRLVCERLAHHLSSRDKLDSLMLSLITLLNTQTLATPTAYPNERSGVPTPKAHPLTETLPVSYLDLKKKEGEALHNDDRNMQRR